MLKGVNRQVLEVTETNNIYYEKALLVIRPEYRHTQQAVLEREAKNMLKGMKPPSAIRKKSRLGYWMLRLGSAAIFGGAIATFIIHFYF